MDFIIKEIERLICSVLGREFSYFGGTKSELGGYFFYK